MGTTEQPDANRVGATFASLEDAEQAVEALKGSGVSDQDIKLSHGAGDQDLGAGTTGAQDEAVASGMMTGGIGGAATGSVVGLILGAVIGTFVADVASPNWWAATLGAGFAGGGVGLFWGLVTRFGRRGASGAGARIADPVTVVVQAHTPDEAAAARQVLQGHGGDTDVPSPRVG